MSLEAVVAFSQVMGVMANELSGAGRERVARRLDVLARETDDKIAAKYYRDTAEDLRTWVNA